MKRENARKSMKYKENKNNTLSPFSYSLIPPSRRPPARIRVYARGG